MPRVYKKKLEEAIFKLLEVARELDVAVQFKDHRTCEEIWPEACGIFDCQKNQVTIYKSIEKPLTVQHVHTLAHELRHAWQFRTRMMPMQWLCNI